MNSCPHYLKFNIFDRERIYLNIQLQWHWKYLASWATGNIRNIFIIKYFCQEQSRSRLKCSILQKSRNFKKTREQLLLSPNLFQDSFHQNKNHI